MAGNLRFITKSPFSEAYREGVESEDRRNLRLAQLAEAEQGMDIRAAQAPVELRRGRAQASSAETAADVARKTAPYDVQKAGTAAERGAFDLGHAQRMSPSQVAAAQTAAERGAFELGESRATAPFARRSVEAGARTAEAGADVAQQTIGSRVQTSQNQARLGGAQASYAENRRKYEMFDKGMEALGRGQIEIAQQLMVEGGEQIPPELLKHAHLQRAVASIWADAKRMAPDNPEKQTRNFQIGVRAMFERAATGAGVVGAETKMQDPERQSAVERAGIPTYDPTFAATEPGIQTEGRKKTYQPLTILQGGKPSVGAFDPASGTVTPTGVEGYGRGYGGAAGSGRMSVYEQKRQAYLSVNPGDTAGALEYASGRKRLSPADEMKLATQIAKYELGGTMQAMTNPGLIQNRANEILQEWRASQPGLRNVTATPQQPTTTTRGGSPVVSQPMPPPLRAAAPQIVGVPIPPEFADLPDGSVLEDDSGAQFTKQGEFLIPNQ